MQSRNRDGRDGNNSWPVTGGFPSFPDPFAGFGFGGRPSFFGDIFENDPFFNDPFFARPFISPFGSAASPQNVLLSAGGLFGPDRLLDRGLFHQRGSSVEQGNFFDQRLQNPSASEGNRRNLHIEEGPRGVHIEELPEDHDMEGNRHHSLHQEPIIEHPDDEEIDSSRREPDNSGDQQLTALLDASYNQSKRAAGPSRIANNNPVHAYSFQRSSVMYAGPNGPYYSSQTTRRQGPGGVIEEEHQEKDTSSGRETHRVSRGLGDKGRSLTRKRNAEGREEGLETLHNLVGDDVQNFERAWDTAAEKSLPRWTKSSSQRLMSSSRVWPALPSRKGSQSHGH